MQRRGRGSSSRQVESNWSSDRGRIFAPENGLASKVKGGTRISRIQRKRPDRSCGIDPSSTPQKTSLWAARGEFPAPGIIRQIRWIREIRVPTLNLDASPDNPGTSNGTRARSKESRDDVDQKPGEATDQRSVDPDVLKVSANRELDAPRRRVGIPVAHRLRDEVRDLRLIPLDHVERDLGDPAIDLLQQCRIGEQRLAERR